MAEDGMEDLVELGFEAFDHGVDKFYDKAYNQYSKHSPWKRRQSNQQGNLPQRDSQQGNSQQRRRARSEPLEERDRSGPDGEDGYQYRQDNQTHDNKDRDRARELPRTSYRAYSPPYTQQRAMKGSEYEDFPQRPPQYGVPANIPRGSVQPQPRLRRDQLAHAPPPPAAYPQYYPQHTGQQYPPLEGDHSMNPRRSPEWDERSRRSRPRRPRRRSQSSSGKGLASVVVGALAGGLAGNELNKGDAMTTMAGAVIGAVGAREVKKQLDKRKEKTREDDEKWQRRHSRDDGSW